MTTVIPLKNEDLEAKRDLIKRTICKGSSDDELQLFIHACKRTGLDPFMKQIHAVKRGDVMTIQTGIDGLRLIADRSGNYSPGREPTFQYDKDSKLISATAYIKKRTSDGVWHEVSATAFLSEYKPTYKNNFWESKPHLMLAKCSEALALRKAFPAEMSGLYTHEEMEQATPMPSQIDEIPIQPVQEEDVFDLIEKFKKMVEIPESEYFEDYLQFVQSKLQGKKLEDVVKGWLKDPQPCINYYKNWLSKNSFTSAIVTA